MQLESGSSSDEAKSYKIKPILYAFTLLGIAEAFSFLNSEGVWIKIFFIFIFFFLSCFTFFLLKKRGKCTPRQLYLYRAVVALIIICSIIGVIIKYWEDQLIPKNEISSEIINTSFTGNTVGQVHIYNMPSKVNSEAVVASASQISDGISKISIHSRKTSASMAKSGKKQAVLQNKQPIYIEEEAPLSIMDVPEGADDKKMMKPVLPLNT